MKITRKRIERIYYIEGTYSVRDGWARSSNWNKSLPVILKRLAKYRPGMGLKLRVVESVRNQIIVKRDPARKAK
jgi:hypothetical protein